MKKIAFMFAIIFLLQNKAFTQFEMHLIVPMGAGFGSSEIEGTQLHQYYPDSINYESMHKEALGVNAGVLMQMGTRFDLKNEAGLTSISLLLDIGYSLEAFLVLFDEPYYISDRDYVTEDMTLLHTLNIGIIPKLNFWFPSMKIPFSIGFGGGVKIPFSGKKYLTKPRGQDTEEDLSYQDIKKTFEYPFIPYIKLTYDTYFYVSEKVAFTFGSYLSYDFGMKYDTDKLNAESALRTPWHLPSLKLTEYSYSSFNFGISFGVYFGKPAPRPKKAI